MLDPAEQMALLRQTWAAQVARNDKPSPAWVILTESGELVGWALVRRAAEKSARKRAMSCHVARLDPRTY